MMGWYHSREVDVTEVRRSGKWGGMRTSGLFHRAMGLRSAVGFEKNSGHCLNAGIRIWGQETGKAREDLSCFWSIA